MKASPCHGTDLPTMNHVNQGKVTLSARGLESAVAARSPWGPLAARLGCAGRALCVIDISASADGETC